MQCHGGMHERRFSRLVDDHDVGLSSVKEIGLERNCEEAEAAAERSLNRPMAGAQVARSLAWWMSAIGATSENIHSMRVIPGGPKADMGCASQQPRMIGAAEAGAV